MEKKFFILISIITLTTAALDRLFKLLAENDFFYPPIRLIGNVFQLNFAANKYISFSLPIGGIGLIAAIIFILVCLTYYFAYCLKKGEQKKASLVMLVLLGAVSNLFDRFKYGYVVDYFDLKYFTVFNLADDMIVCGTILLIWTLRDKKTI
jgi:signal peptidase II